MLQTVRVSSKRQITIPADLFRMLNLSKGDRLVMEASGDRLVMQKSKALLERMAGSLKLPEKYKGMEIEEIITEAKEEYFSGKK